MDVYEQNYLLLRRLAPALQQLPLGDRVSAIQGCPALHLSMIVRERYTTTLNLAWHLPQRPHQPKRPDMLIRMYHDAKTAEVLSDRHHTRQTMRTLHTSWKSNRFLYKWLRYCLHCGHCFDGKGK